MLNCALVIARKELVDGLRDVRSVIPPTEDPSRVQQGSEISSSGERHCVPKLRRIDLMRPQFSDKAERRVSRNYTAKVRFGGCQFRETTSSGRNKRTNLA
jgi:hypothetical protein